MVGGRDGGADGRLADRPAEEVGAHLADALQWDELLAAQVDQPGVEAEAVLGGGVDAGGEVCRDLSAGVRAELDLGAVLVDDELLWRQVEYLPGFVADEGLLAQVGAAAAGAAPEAVNDDAVGLGDGFKCGAWMAVLPSGVASAWAAQALGGGLGVAVGGRWPAAVGAVLCQAGL